MDLFPDGAHVRLRRRRTGRYFYAEEDAVGVAQLERRASLNAVWAVHRVELHGAAYVLLRGAAYGRYLATYEVPAQAGPPGNRDVHFVQVLYVHPEQANLLWQFFFAGDGNNDVVMSSRGYGVWPETGSQPGQNNVMRWVVEAVPARPEPPVLPAPGPPAPANGNPIQPQPRREIRFVWADDYGNFPQHEWGTGTVSFDGRSVFDLRRRLASELGIPEELNITLCVQAGSLGRLTPLVIDLLPSVGFPMDIVVLTVGSPAANALVYPDVDAP